MTSVSSRIIIGLYLQFRQMPENNQDAVRVICRTIGYNLNKNGTNTYVRRIIREFLESEKSKELLQKKPGELRTVTVTLV